MTVFVTGYQGRLGKYLIDKLGYFPLRCDVTELSSIKIALRNANEDDTIIHCAAVTDVDGCEGALHKQAIEVNVKGTHNIRSAFRGQIVYLSTDYVFDGRDGAYSEEAEPNPQSHYGKTKMWGEEAILEVGYPRDVILRTTVLYGGHKPDFVTRIISQLKTNDLFKVTGSLMGSPTYVPHLAKGIKKLLMLKQPPKIINIVGKDVISRWVFACMIAKVFGYPVYNVLLTMRGQMGAATRPMLGGLKVDLARTLNIPIYSVKAGLDEMKNG